MEVMRNILKKAPERPKPSALNWVVYIGMFALSLTIFYALALRGGSDLSIHATWAAEGNFLQPRTFLRHGAHPLWHGLVAAVMLVGIPVKWAAALVTAVLKVAELWLIRRLISFFLQGKMKESTITWAAVCCAMVMSLCVPWINPTVYYGIGSPNTWHSPTQLIAMVMMLLCVPYAAHCYAEFERLAPLHGAQTLLPWKKAAALGSLLFLSLLAKPTFMQAFLPAAGIFLLAQWWRHPQNSRFFGQIILAVLPAVLFMVVQYMYYFGIIVPSQGSMALEVSLQKVLQTLVATLLIQAFPLYVLLTCTKPRDFKSPLLSLTLLLDAVGVLEFLLLGETGRRAADGNFGWGMMGGALMLWIVAMILFLRSFTAARQAGKGKLRHAGGFALLGWHLASGLFYIVYLLAVPANL